MAMEMTELPYVPDMNRIETTFELALLLNGRFPWRHPVYKKTPTNLSLPDEVEKILTHYRQIFENTGQYSAENINLSIASIREALLPSPKSR